ncbi:NAD-dependent epimerase/dehydratase family protein [Methylobacterium nodulans]|uniref:NAD-dependent epimerase/dehydratase n=1 Tax=Methylobacterium nodulans (strain LMG 21967 / CNCM I-2342 / ORS 2060) TaxID=460265 RepID=B8IQD0_METNO|nr:NAD(P)-dependent oxidoreductase [Methylobacterium nodulans]ACL60442.1 NAD-dependent epimerase/dehydratase [Methylobacterium nodulans ORS 2060]
MRIMVIGGNGFVGRPLSRLLSAEHEVCVLDTLRYGGLRFTGEELSRLKVVLGDITDPDEVAAAVAAFRPEAIIHLAAIHYIPECEQDPGLAVRVNVAGTVNLLSACPPGCRFVFASSGAVYKADTRPHTEDGSAVEPSDIYGFTKLHGEHYVRYMAGLRGFPAVVVRLFNVIGPGETNPHLMPEIVAQLKAGYSRIALGNLTPKRDYVHVEDAARGFMAAALAGEVARGACVTVNLGTSCAYSVDEIVRKLRQISGLDFAVASDPARIRAVDRPVLAADIGRIRTLFGWEPARSIDAALADLWQRPDLSTHLTTKYRLEPAGAPLPRSEALPGIAAAPAR